MVGRFLGNVEDTVLEVHMDWVEQLVAIAAEHPAELRRRLVLQ